ncbi:MAG: phage protease, partial [Elusimicrobiota bacterium]
MKAATPPVPSPTNWMTGAAQRLDAAIHLAESSDGLARFPWFPLGRPEMDDEDWRQFEVTPENVRRMVDDGNAEIAQGEEIWINYGHDHSGPRAGDVVRFEVGPDGGVHAAVRWNDNAKSAIRQKPPEWKYFSPEYHAVEVQDEQGNRVLVNGRVLHRPFHLCGGGLVNNPAMKKLAVAASASPHQPSPAEASRKEEPMKLPLTMKALGLADGASQEDVDSAVMKVIQERDTVKEKLTAAASDVKAIVKAEVVAEREAMKAEVRTEMAVEHAKKARETRVADLVKRADDEGKVNEDNKAQVQEMAAAAPDSFEKLVLPGLPVVAAVKAWFKAGRTEPGVDPDGPESSTDLDRKAREYQKA